MTMITGGLSVQVDPPTLIPVDPPAPVDPQPQQVQCPQ